MIVKNYLYNVSYQILVILLPIITIPYISRVLGVEGIGRYALTNAYAQYFVLFGMIGLLTYGSREIARVKDDIIETSQVFWEINIIRFVTMGISFFFYIAFIVWNLGEDYKLYIAQSTVVLSAWFDISWLFIGLENFKKVVRRNILVRVIGTILIFVLVQDSSQVWLYALILGGTQLIGQLIMWIEIPKGISWKKPRKVKMIKHLKGAMILFLPQIAINIYTMLDKVMLGSITTDFQVGLYDNAQKVIRIASTIVTSLATVMVPRMVYLYHTGEFEEFKEKVYNSFSFVSFIAFPLAFGLMGITSNFVPWFYGKGFEEIDVLFYIGASLIITLGWSSIVGSQVLVSIGREKKFTVAVIIGAIVNIGLNMEFINQLGAVGTTISSVIAEFTGMFIMVYFLKDIINIKYIFEGFFKYFTISAGMGIIVHFIGKYLQANIFSTFIQIMVGLFIYLMIMYLIKDKHIVLGIKMLKNYKQSNMLID